MGDSLMESRGQKRLEMVEELPADKRACNSFEFRPSSSTVTPEMLTNSTSASFGVHTETSSSTASISGHSEGERDSPNRSYDSDEMDDDDDHDHDHDHDDRFSSLRDLQRSRSQNDIGKLDQILTSLNNDAEPSGQLAALTELCELVLFCTEDSFSGSMGSQLASSLVKLANHESNPDIMLLAIRGLTYLCDVYPRLPSLLVRLNAIPSLCQRLMVIEYLDVAEQCVQALEKISHDQPRACLQSGAIISVLNFVDFFSPTVQRAALRTVVNICKVLSSEFLPPVMEAVPQLCNLLQYKDHQIVELVATCLIKVGNSVKDSPTMLTELYNHGLVNQVTHLIDSNTRITLSQKTFMGLIGLITKIASGSSDVISALFGLEIGRILKDVLSNSELSHGIPSPRTMDNNYNQVHKVLELLHELLPEVVKDKNEEISSSTERILLDKPGILEKFGMDILPTLMELVNSGANVNICYGCLSVTNRLVCLSKPETLIKLFEGVNIASFLAGLFMQKDDHLLLFALQISETILEKLANILIPDFIKEGVLFSIDNLLNLDSSHPTSPIISDSEIKETIVGKEILGCLCFTYRKSQTGSNSESKTCKANKDSILTIARRIKMTYFSLESPTSRSMVTDLLEELRNSSLTINNLLSMSMEENNVNEEKLSDILSKVILKLGGNLPVSTFELIESGSIKALLNYLLNGQFLSNNYIANDLTHAFVVQKRFESFTGISFSLLDSSSQDFTLSSLVRKLHNALSTVETFPVITGYATRQRVSYVNVPKEGPILHPCLKVCFVRGEEELCLSDYSKDVVNVDPFCLVEEIEGFLRPKVNQIRAGLSEVNTTKDLQEVKARFGLTNCDASSLPDELGEHLGSESTSKVLPDLEISPKVELPLQSSNATENLAGISTPSKLALYLDGEQLNYSFTLYQEILERRIKSQNDLHNDSKLWSNTYTITYRSVSKNGTSCNCIKCQKIYDHSTKDRIPQCWEVLPIFSDLFSCKRDSQFDKLNPTNDILFLLKSLEVTNKFRTHLISSERMNGFVEGRFDNLDDLKVKIPGISQYEFVSTKLTEKLEQQMRDPSIVHVGALPLWCSQLISKYPFLFSFEVRFKYFQLAAFGKLHILPDKSDSNSRERRVSSPSSSRKKFLVRRERILESASQMMDLYAQQKVVVEVEYSEEVGTGLGPTLEFYTLVSHEFQKCGLGMWRGDNMSKSGFMVSTCGLFPRPWSSSSSNFNGVEYSDVVKKFGLLGQFVGKAIQDGRVLDIPFSIAFYKLVLGKELSLYDIQSFDPGLGRTLLELKAFIGRRKFMESTQGGNISHDDLPMFRGAKIEDLCLDFTLPGYPDYTLSSRINNVMVNINNLEEYISLVLDATLRTGVSKQVEAFISGLNQVIPVKYLKVFTEEEFDRLLCGERDSWISSDQFDHIKFDHGYTACSPPIIDLLEVISEFTYVERRAFLQFVTGTPRLPPGGLASLNPKLTIVRKHSNNNPDSELPSVMTCANYLKLPPYSSKEILKEKLLYAITEGQGSFHLS